MTDRNGWPAAYDDDADVLTVTAPNGAALTYRRCHHCKGTGAVEGHGSELLYCNACACRGWLLVKDGAA